MNLNNIVEDSEFKQLLLSISSESDESTSSNSSVCQVDVRMKSKHRFQSRKEMNKKSRKIVVSVPNSFISVEFEACFPRPRVVRTDIRRSYANMFTNALNSANFPLLYGFFDTFCNRSYSHSITRQLNKAGHSPYTYQRKGVLSCAQFWFLHMLLMPDTVSVLTNAVVISPEDSLESRIECSYSLRATKIYDGGLLLLNDECGCFEDGVDTMEAVLRSTQMTVEALPPVERPLQIGSDGVYTMFLDEHKRLTRLEMNSIAFAVSPV